MKSRKFDGVKNYVIECKKRIAIKLNITHKVNAKSEEVPERHFEVEKSISVKNASSHLTLRNSNNPCSRRLQNERC